MKKVFKLALLFSSFVLTTTISANNISFSQKSVDVNVKYPDCWAAADAAEENSCGSVGCNFDLWDAVYGACMGWD
ncbi:hypothetical protein ACG2LH_05345 [Zhouia sp. PK063]|uniref:hypothetical protein n=1 Tax=Zhouia sp. PK063 TaxID=3373602 RepID=UPI0037B86225